MDVQSQRRSRRQRFQTHVNRSFVEKYKKTTLTKSTSWTTKKAATFKTDRKVKCQFTLPEFHEGKDISWNMYVNESDARLNNYDMIIGGDLVLHELGIDLLFSLGVMKWDNATVPMKDPSQSRDSNMMTLKMKSSACMIRLQLTLLESEKSWM
jgi:hypothetical protein